MKQRGIIMRDWEVRAIREGRKTQKRFIIKPQPRVIHAIYNDASIETNLLFRRGDQRIHCPYGKLGDRLFVKERWMDAIAPDGFVGAPQVKRGPKSEKLDGWIRVAWHSDSPDPWGWPVRYGWKSPVTMPHWASRITLEIVSVRAQRLQDIAEEDAIAEGCSPETRAEGTLFRGSIHPVKGTHKVFPCAKAAYRDIWESIHGPGSWDRDDFVFAVEFKEAKP